MIPGQYCSECDGSAFVPFIPRLGQKIGCPKCNGSTRELMPCPCGCGALKRSPLDPADVAGPAWVRRMMHAPVDEDELNRRVLASIDATIRTVNAGQWAENAGQWGNASRWM